jgi:hypothetical protein
MYRVRGISISDLFDIWYLFGSWILVFGICLPVVSQVGFEPTTRCLEGSRSIQLSYWDISVTHKFYDKSSAKTSHPANGLLKLTPVPAQNNYITHRANNILRLHIYMQA